MAMDRTKARDLLQAFEFEKLLIEIGWESVPPAPPKDVGNTGYQYRLISETVFEVFPENPRTNALPNASMRAKIHKQIEQISFENLIIFLDNDKNRTQSIWYWVKREDNRKRPRPHEYWKEQPGDLFLSKVADMVIEMGDRRADGTLPITERTKRFANSFDIRPVTKNFYKEFSGLREDFGSMIQGIPRESDRLLYASVLLNRLMFIYFLQKKDFIQNNGNYLDAKLKESKRHGPDRYYNEFLEALFFEGLAKPERERSEDARRLLGKIPYLNGGLFIRHKLELDYDAIRIPDIAFENVLRLFGEYSWYLDDTQGADDNVINPDVLGYIFEKYINQKAFGAYYTPTEITEYLCKRSIHAALLQRVNQYSNRQFRSWGDVKERLDARLCRLLLFEILPKLSILDPACGSGAFLVAALKNLINIYSAIYGRIDFSNDALLRDHKDEITSKHPSLHYYIRKQIIVDNLYGVDIMDEATEIAKLRLFLALVGVAQKLDDLEPLPNIDFNIISGNSLIGLLKVDEVRFDDKKQMQYMFQDKKAEDYRREVAEKNRLVRIYRNATSFTDALETLRRTIDEHRAEAYRTLNDIQLDDFKHLGIQYEEAQLQGNPIRYALETQDMNALIPFHWGYEFDEIMETRGGFDVIITNPPWEIFQADQKEFFGQYDNSIKKKKMSLRDFKAIRDELLLDQEISKDWLHYESEFPHQRAYFKEAPQYKYQNGGKVNLFKVFLEQCFNLLRDQGTCGIVLPSGFYIDKDKKDLRRLLFERTKVSGLFGFENRKKIFEDVDSRFKFVVLTFMKGGQTQSLPAAFMRHYVSELDDFPREDSIVIDVPLLKRLSPNSLTITEYNNQLEVQLAKKTQQFPLLVEEIFGTWNIQLTTEFDKSKNDDIFYPHPSIDRRPLYEGRMISHFTHQFAHVSKFVDLEEGEGRLRGTKGNKSGFAFEEYRLIHRRVTNQTNDRSLLCSIIPQNCFCDNSVNYVIPSGYTSADLFFVSSMWSSYIVDYQVRRKINNNITQGVMEQLSIPRYRSEDPFFDSIIRRAAKLICTTPEFDDLATEVGLGSHHNGVTDPAGRAKLRAELDGIIAHIYGLTEDEFAYVLSTFPLVADPVKVAALNAYRDVERGVLS
ncbi:MAG: Eco57I restriction-modification methylase domain-containing protein [Chloroflexi bacterium]|nr:Eco57I restriction-modification methylase domain-containing protein [Chloroflexota bacterium]